MSKMCWSYIDTLVSGTPIIRNGKPVGAVTHVLVDDPANTQFSQKICSPRHRV